MLASSSLASFEGLRACRQPEASRAAAAGPQLPRSRRLRHACAAAAQRETDPKKRVVITGMGIASVFGNDPASFYDSLLAGRSGVSAIERFDASEYPTRFAGQIKGFECVPGGVVSRLAKALRPVSHCHLTRLDSLSSEGFIDKKNDRRLDDCLRYALVSGKKALADAGLALDSDAFKSLDKQRCARSLRARLSLR